MESILNSIKKMLGLSEDYFAFDTDIIIHINSVFAMMPQITDLLPADFRITGPGETWTDYVGNAAVIEFVKTFVYLRVRLLFDPPTGGVLDAMKETVKEMEWRMSIADNLGASAEQHDNESEDNPDGSTEE